ncbi:hypothetical protein GCM10022225_50050 [Plantactinospora mayteni]|uniref:Uncharacterized protein n=1 Tax=Plantactinospora mayteni TaxID=566021 RepID=A0ABQ4EXX9_9ACTN|nr:hypothetical protein [Plantactinospora mayteni]GIG99503.1 hypothetical protein Pma05_60760 [Plantactinospora mayteni]
MLSGMRSLAAGTVLLTALVAGCDDGGAAPGTDSPAPAPATGNPGLDPTSTAPERQPHSLVLTATGDARIDSFSYVLDGRATHGESVRLPWRQAVEVPADGERHEWSLTVKYQDGEVELVAVLNGQRLTTGRGSGSGTVSVNGSVEG